MKKIIALSLVLMTSVYIYADEMHEHKHTVNTDNKTMDVNQSKETEKMDSIYGNKMICPITGEEFSVNKKTPFIEYEGKKYYFCCDSCVDEFKKEPEKYTSKTDLIIGNKFICPVMGTKFIPTSKSPKVEYKGKTYYFCCPGCVEKFNKEPEKYIKQTKTNKKHQHKHNGKMCNMCDKKKVNNESKESNIKKYSLEDVSKHNKKGDCWLIINDKVYNVSDFTYKHNENILLGCGKDATKLFETRTTDDGKKIGSGKPHSENAHKMREKFYIGDLSK